MQTSKPMIVELSLNEIKPYWRNPRNIEESVPAVMNSIVQYGYNNLITVDENNVIITGHTRHQALKRLGYEKVNVMQITHLDTKKVKEFRIADNKTQELAKWNENALILELKEIGDLDDMQVFFPDDDLAAWVGTQDGDNWGTGVSQDNIDKKQAEMQNSMTDMQNVRQNDMIELSCPHCAEVYMVRRGEIMKQMVQD